MSVGWGRIGTGAQSDVLPNHFAFCREPALLGMARLPVALEAGSILSAAGVDQPGRGGAAHCAVPDESRVVAGVEPAGAPDVARGADRSAVPVVDGDLDRRIPAGGDSVGATGD